VSAPTTRVSQDILRLARKGRIVFTVSSYTVLAPLGYLLFALSHALWRGDELLQMRRMQALTAAAYRFMHRWLHLARITRFDVATQLEHLPEGACVVVANHPTLMDVTSIIGLLNGACTVAKPGLYQRWLLRGVLQGSGVIEGAGSNPMGAGRVMDEAVERLGQGFSMVVFPEGTRSPRGKMLPFGRAAFEMACRAKVPVVSVTITCEPVWLSKEQPLFDPPFQTPRLTLATLAIDDPARVDYDSRRLCQVVEGRYEQWFLGQSPEDPSAVAPKDTR